jgi:maleylacetoacetate isomerase
MEAVMNGPQYGSQQISQSDSQPYQLYSYFRSSCSYRVRIALHLKGLAFKYIPIHLLNNGGEQNQSAYLEQNPQGEVPFLSNHSWGLGQSMAILEYLEEAHPNIPLLSSDIKTRALTRQICETINAGTQPLQNLKVLQYLSQKLNVDEEEKNKWARHWIEKGLHATERMIAKTRGEYSVGNQLSFADCFLIPQVYNAHRFHVDMNGLPNIVAINKACSQIPAFIASHPDQQPDSPAS